ncbi:MAG: VWA domain-containing protein [Methanobrevibacter sp.]|jgi:uncharacterized protein with von Willebrand factor type A (vWA) domain|nr:VWA domain-containing protein [Candidatus Methanovirga aequatorialis]
MIEDIVKFSGKLRDNGIPASVRSTKLACKAKTLIKNDGNLKDAMASIYLKDQRFRNKFDEIYEDFFINKKEEKENKNIQNKGKTPFKTYIGSSTSRRTSKRYFDRDSKYYRIDYLENSLNNMNNDGAYEGNSKLLKNDIKNMNSLQVELVDLCQKLGHKIATKRSRQLKMVKTQKIDIRRSIRKNLKHGGTFLELIKTKPKIKKHDHYFLSDISVSCDWISIWFFCMVYASQNSFSKAKVYEFDNKTVDITSALYEPDLIDAFIKVMKIRHENSMIHGKSNMYMAFKEFQGHTNINSKSYLLILSDCRDWAGKKENGIPKSAEIIENMVKKSKRVLILNPEEKKKWNVADSCVSNYEDAGAELFEVRNLEQLAELIVEI